MGNPGLRAEDVARDALHVIVQVEPREIMYVGQVFEGHDHVGILSTYDKEWGIVDLSVSPDLGTTALEILEALRQEFPMSIIAIQ